MRAGFGFGDKSAGYEEQNGPGQPGHLESGPALRKPQATGRHVIIVTTRGTGSKAGCVRNEQSSSDSRSRGARRGGFTRQRFFAVFSGIEAQISTDNR